ncbi:MAG: ComEC/Rec2 family competence protein [Akkermansia sp.]|nr:ComEC/Rec2 family competence protein [Akkermansia sp.]
MPDVPDDVLAKGLRRLFIGAPLFLPLLGVVGALGGGNWWILCIAAFSTAHILKLPRIFFCILLCVGIALVHRDILQQNEQRLRDQLAAYEHVHLEGTVERVLSRGCILNTGPLGVRVVLRGTPDYKTGDRLRVTAQRRDGRKVPVKGMFNTAVWMKSQGLAANLTVLRSEYIGKSRGWLSALGAAEAVRRRLVDNIMPEGSAGDARHQVLCALALGDKSLAEQPTLNIFKRGGCLHAFAVSGLHVGIVAGFLYILAHFFRLSPRTRTVLVLLVVGVYVFVTGLAVPALRAYLMIALSLVGLELRRRVSMLNIWSFAALIVLLCSPWQWHNAGFVLSFAVYAGIGLGIKWCMRSGPWMAPDAYLPTRLYNRWQHRLLVVDYSIRGTVIVSLSAWLVSLPITLCFFYTVTPFSFLTNIAIAPLLPFVMGSGLLTALAGSIPWLGGVLQWAALQCSSCLIAVCSFFGSLPMAYISGQPPQPPDAAHVCHLGYEESYTVLGNPGVVIGCGSETSAQFVTEPSLFFGGFRPAVLVAGSGDKGTAVLKESWPGLKIIHSSRLRHIRRISTSAGDFTVYPSVLSAAGSAAVVYWQSPQKRVLYIGNADSMTVASLPTDVGKGADVIILGYNRELPVDFLQLVQEMKISRCVLLPNVPQRVAESLPDTVEVLRVSEDSPLIPLP